MKKLVVVEQGKYINHNITLKKHSQLKDTGIDIIRFNWFTDEDPLADYSPKDVGGEIIRWSQGRDFLMSKVVDKYDFILYTDEDTYLEDDNSESNPWESLLSFLNEWNPLAVNVHTPNIWCKDERIIKRLKDGKPSIIRKHDACNVVLRNDIAKLLHPIEFHGSDGVTHYQQFLCHKLRKEYYLSPPHLISVNGIEEQHHHVDDRSVSYREGEDGIYNKFAKKLKNPNEFIDNFIKNTEVTTEELLSIEPLKNAPEISIEEFQSLFN